MSDVVFFLMVGTALANLLLGTGMLMWSVVPERFPMLSLPDLPLDGIAGETSGIFVRVARATAS